VGESVQDSGRQAESGAALDNCLPDSAIFARACLGVEWNLGSLDRSFSHLIHLGDRVRDPLPALRRQDRLLDRAIQRVRGLGGDLCKSGLR